MAPDPSPDGRLHPIRPARATRGRVKELLAWALLAALVAPAAALAQAPDSAAADTARRSSLAAYPYVFYTPETEFALGAGGVFTFYTDDTTRLLRPSKVSASAYWSTRDQFKVTITPAVYFSANRRYAEMPTTFGVYVDKFWGVGNETPDLPQPDYDAWEWSVIPRIELPSPFPGPRRLGVLLELTDRIITDPLANPVLQPDTLTGADGGYRGGVGGGLVWDTRDHTFTPAHGWLGDVTATWYTGLLGSSFKYLSLTADFRWYRPLGEAVLAVQAYGAGTTEGAPFYALPAVGGGTRLRGYYEGRYRDQFFAMAQVEYRRHLFWRLGAVGFAGAGDVFGSEASDLSLRELKWSVGGGLRVLFNQRERINLRADLGVGRDGTGVYFGLEEAF